MTKKIPYQTISEKALGYIRNGAPKPVSQMTVDEIPPVAISWGRTDVFPTGSWRNITPHYVKKLPPCRAGCPLGNDIEGWLEAAGNQQWDDAVKLLIEEQPLPAVCGRVCYHPCETYCNRGRYDEAVNIRAVERSLGDRSLEINALPDMSETRGNGGRVLIVGSGPGGLAAAWMLTRLGYKTEIVDRSPEPGGLLRYGIPAYRLPRDVLKAEISRFEKMGVTFRLGADWNLSDGLVGLGKEFDAIFLAPGAAGHRSSGVVSSSQWVVQNAIEFLTRAAANQPHHLGQNVVVVGGGNSAIDAARTALRCGSNVTIVYRRSRMEMPAYHEEVEAALAEGVRIVYLANPEMIRRSNVGNGKYLRCIRNVLGKPDDSGRRRPESVPGSEFELPIDNVIDAVGEFPDPGQLTDDGDMSRILTSVDCWGRTSLDGVWTGGDFAGNDRTVAHAIGAGKRAAISIDACLNGNDAKELDKYILDDVSGSISARGYIRNEFTIDYFSAKPVSFESLNIDYFDKDKRNAETVSEASNRNKGFAEVTRGFGVNRTYSEARRCFHCGSCDSCGNCHVFCPDGAIVRDSETLVLSIDLQHCKGCGVCASECPRSAIEMFK